MKLEKHIGRFLKLFFLAIAFSAVANSFAQETITSSSVVDWTKQTFKSSVSLDLEKAGIQMPSGKNSAVNRINMQLPILIKDPLLSLYVDSNSQLGDLVLDETITLEQLTDIIDNGKKTPGVFADGTSSLKTAHEINLLNIGSLLIKHHTPYRNSKPIEQISSKAYSGIIIDARGKFPVHGEFVEDNVNPCFFPEIWDEKMNRIYERNMADPQKEIKQGMVYYDWSDEEKRYEDRIGVNPMHITAREVYGSFRTDPVISHNDALRILTIPENLDLLRDGKVVILLDKEKLSHPVGAPQKDEAYYTAYRDLKNYLYNDVAQPEIIDTYKGIQILYDLKFKADSPELLSSEYSKIKNLADSLKKINENNAFTILIEGHTADVNKPEGQMELSIQRTQTIINELIKSGLSREIFSYKGYGGTQPLASNATPEGRAVNRRVIITARPKATYIQRQ